MVSTRRVSLLRTSKRQDLPAVRNLAVVYTLAGADCIDVAAEEAVIEAARYCLGVVFRTKQLVEN